MVKNHYTYAIIQAISEMQILYQDLEAQFLSLTELSHIATIPITFIHLDYIIFFKQPAHK